MAFLVHRQLAGRTLLSEVEGDVLRIGRGAGADLRLDDDAVSWEHAEIHAMRAGWEVADLGSVTGTYVDGWPVQHAPLASGSVVQIGGFRIRVQVTDADDPLFVHVSGEEGGVAAAPRAAWGASQGPAWEEPETKAIPLPLPGAAAVGGADSRSVDQATGVAPAGGGVEKKLGGAEEGGGAAAARVDYVRAYALARPGWTKGLATLAVAGVTLAVAGFALAGGKTRWFQPGISPQHAPAAQAAGQAASERSGARAVAGCLDCHRPWRGPAEAGCVECHRPPAAAPHAAALATRPQAVLPCSSCHPEHRDVPLVTVEEASCIACHGDLGAVLGEAPHLAARISSFAVDHPELTVALAGGRRVPVPAAAGGDPAILGFGHVRHKVRETKSGDPAAALAVPGLGRVELACNDCHRPAPATATGPGSAPAGAPARMAPIRFEDHCQRCHKLTFDPAYPDVEARHRSPAEVYEFLAGVYLRGGPGAVPSGSQRDRYLSALAGGVRSRRPAGIDRQVEGAARYLFRSACVDCHRVDLDARPWPAVAPAAIPSGWFAGEPFSHSDRGHAAVPCGRCHPAAEASRETADVLVPGIATCRECHGETAPPGGPLALLGCTDCHSYHRPATTGQAAPAVTPAS